MQLVSPIFLQQCSILRAPRDLGFGPHVPLINQWWSQNLQSIVVLDFDLSFLCLFGYSVILFGFHVQIEIQRRTRSLFPPGTAMPPWVRKCRRAGRWSHRWSRWALRTKSPAPRKRMKKVSVIVSMLEFWFWHVELELVRRRPEIAIHYENVWNIFKTF